MSNHDKPPQSDLARRLGVFHLFAMAFGMIVGVGWITVAGVWISDGGSLGSIAMFGLGWMFMCLIVLCYAEIAAMFPVAGGEVPYVYRILGSGPAFLAGWFLALVYISVTAFEAISIAWVLSAMFPGMEGPVLYSVLGTDVDLHSLLIGLAGMAVVTGINYIGVRQAAAFQSVMVYSLLVVVAVFVTAGILAGDPANLAPAFGAPGTQGVSWLGLLAVFAVTPFWFSGFDIVPQALDLSRLPRILVGSITVALVLYCLVILAATLSMPREALLAADLPPAAAIGAALESDWWARVVLFGGLLGLISTWNAIFYGATRLIYALGRAHLIPRAFGFVHERHHTPHVAICFVGAVGGLGAFMGREAIIPIVNIGATILSTLFLVISIGVIVLRRRMPSYHRPYRVPGFPWLPGVAALFAGAMLILSLITPLEDAQVIPVEWGILGGWLILGLLFWRLASRTRVSLSEAEREARLLHG
jgi:amino acid transporter